MTALPSDSDRLQITLEETAMALARAVGLPKEFGRANGQRVPLSRSRDPIVDRDQVPEPAWRGACVALDFITLALGVYQEGEGVSVEAGLAMLTGPPDPETTP